MLVVQRAKTLRQIDRSVSTWLWVCWLYSVPRTLRQVGQVVSAGLWVLQCAKRLLHVGQLVSQC